MFKTTMDQLEPATRKELEALLARPTEAFLTDFNDMVGFLGLALLGCVGGVGVSIWHLATEPDAVAVYLEYPSLALSNVGVGGIVLGVPLALWLTYFAIRARNRWGFALLSNAVVVVRSGTLKVHPFADIASTSQRVIGARGRRFTVLELKYRDGRTYDLNVTGNWAKLVAERIAGAA